MNEIWLFIIFIVGLKEQFRVVLKEEMEVED